MYPIVTKATPMKPSFLELQFSNGETKMLDVSKYWHSHFFSQLQQWEYFNQVQIRNGTVSWPNEQDIAPETIYLDSK
ncbi:MAG: hypothetical protein HW421_3841 [Ignavibacteria bacterium]|nr:hypothetical protein [Ignavibacteria bacterium]